MIDKKFLGSLTSVNVHLLETVELGALCIHIMLVDFICKDKEIFLVSKLDDCFNVFSCQNLSGWVAWIDDDNCPHITLLLCFFDGPFKLLWVEGPVPCFIKIVAHLTMFSLKLHTILESSLVPCYILQARHCIMGIVEWGS